MGSKRVLSGRERGREIQNRRGVGSGRREGGRQTGVRGEERRGSEREGGRGCHSRLDEGIC